MRSSTPVGSEMGPLGDTVEPIPQIEQTSDHRLRGEADVLEHVVIVDIYVFGL